MRLAKGKTSRTETRDGGSSQNHFMLGQLQEWFYYDLAGIQNATGSAGSLRIIFNPQAVGDVTWAKASYDSTRGKIVSERKRDGEHFTLNISIPANTTATIFVPAKSASDVKKASGAKFLWMENERAVLKPAL